ncbi:MAG TPA: type II toxin-antitoxin system RelE/ParE family toxin [Hyphomonadaceae bacterium]|nr:type II toxin-antitoxin system RelE/ParE family toxin [Hyphomonadaceae bacterium]
MIVGFRDDWLKDFFVDDVAGKQLPASIRDQLFRKLQMIDDATKDQDLRVPPSNHFEKLAGKLKAYRSIWVNRKWRLVFTWNGATGEADDLYLDNHDYR